MFSTLLTRFKMFHRVQIITWLLLFLPLSNQLTDPDKLVNLVPRYYQRTILHGLIQSQATTGEIIDPKMVYMFLAKSDVILGNRITEETFQEIYDKLKDSLPKTLIDPHQSIDLSAYVASQDQSKQKYAQDIGKGASQIAYKTLVQHLVKLYNEYCSLVKNTSNSGQVSMIQSVKNSVPSWVPVLGKKELSLEREVSLTSELIVTSKIQSDYRLGTGSLKQFLSDHVRTIPEPQELFYFTIEAMQRVDSTVTIDPSFSDYLGKLELFDKAFNPDVNLQKMIWDWANVTASLYDIPNVLSMYYEGRYHTFPDVDVPGMAEFSSIVQEWTQAYRLYQNGKLNLDDEEEFKFQRQTEFICGFFTSFKYFRSPVPSLSVPPNANQIPQQSPDLGSSQTNLSVKANVSKCPSLSCGQFGVGALIGVGVILTATYWDELTYKNAKKLLKQFNSYWNPGNGTKSTSKPVVVATWSPTSSPGKEGSSSTLWVIIGLCVCSALLGGVYYIFYHSRGGQSRSETEEDEVKVAKKVKPELKKKSIKEQSKAKKRVVKTKILPPVSKGTPSSAVSSSPQTSSPSSSPKTPPSTLTSQTSTESLATQKPSPKAAANKTKRSIEKKKKKTKKKLNKLNKLDVSQNTKSSASSALVELRNGAPSLPASTLPQTNTLTSALTRTSTCNAPTLETTTALPSSAAVSQQTQTPSFSVV